MSFVEGHILRDERASRAGCPRPSGPRPSDSLVDTLARLHAVDVDAVGLGDFARREGYIARQLKRWHGQFEQSTLDGVPGPGRDRPGVELLAAKIPEQQGVAIVHGDYRLDNTVLDDEGSHRHPRLGDLHARRPAGRPRPPARLLDRARRRRPGRARGGPHGAARLRHPGPAGRALRGGQRAATSRPSPTTGPSAIWKLACILQGVYVRYAGGRRPATAAAWTSSPPPSAASASGPWPTWRRCEPARPVRPLPFEPGWATRRHPARPAGAGGRARGLGRRRHGGLGRHRPPAHRSPTAAGGHLRHRAAHRPAGPSAHRPARGRRHHRARPGRPSACWPARTGSAPTCST